MAAKKTKRMAKGILKVGSRFRVRYADETGEDVRHWMPENATLEEAERHLRDARVRIDRIKAGFEVRDRNPQGLTLADVALRWLKGKGDRDESAVTNHIIRTPLGALQLDKVTPELITEHLEGLQPAAPTVGRTARTEPLAQRTRNHVRKHLVQIFGHALERKLLVGMDNPARAVKIKKVRRKALDTYTAAECARLVNAVHQPWRGILAIALHGLRKGEIWGLNVDDISLERDELRVRRSHGKDLAKDGRERVVPFIPSLRSAIAEAVARAHGRSVPLFPGRDPGKKKPGQLVTRRRNERANLLRPYERAQGLAQVHRIRFHDLRHTCATLLLQAGVPIERVSKILGHSSIAITMDIYGHLVTADLRAAMHRLSFDLPAPRAVGGAP